MNKVVLERVAFLLKSDNPQKDWDFLISLQKEQAPWLDQSLIEDCVIYSLVREYNDHTLMWHWWNSHSQEESIAA